MYGMDVTTVAGQITPLPLFRIHPPLPPERFTPIQNTSQDQVASITASATFGYSASPDNVTMALQ